MYKKKIIEKVLKRDLQPTHFNADDATGKPQYDKSGKKRNTKGVDKQRRNT